MAGTGMEKSSRSPSSILTSISSVSSTELRTLTTCNCELAVLPVALLMELQREYFIQDETTISIRNHCGGYNVFCDGKIRLEGQQFTIVNYMKRKTVLKTHMDYKDYRENLLSKPIVFFTSASKMNAEPPKGKAFAVVVNTRHPRIRQQIEQGMDQAISSVMGENYSLQFDCQKAVKAFFFRRDYSTDGEGLEFTFDFKSDALFDIFYMVGYSKNKAEISGKILNLSCNTEEKKSQVKMFLDKMSEPFIRMGSSSDRRFSSISTGSTDEDVFH